MTITLRFCALVGVMVVLLATVTAGARASVVFQEPSGGWDYTFDGDGDADPGQQNVIGALDGEWIHGGADQWDGSKVGEVTSPNPSDPNWAPDAWDPNGPAPGGVKALADDDLTYLRVQDAGWPGLYGWNNSDVNKKLYFGHDIKRENPAASNVLDSGITLSFRARIAATGTLDMHWPENGAPNRSNIVPWPSEGKGYDVNGDGRGMFGVSHKNGTQSLGFGLILDSEDPSDFDMPGGLVMNNNFGDPGTNAATPETLNLVELSDDDLRDWREFWITIEDYEPGASSYWRVRVYVDGSLTPLVFRARRAFDGEYGGEYLTMGASSDSRHGAYDVDFYSYKLGVVPPALLGDVDLDNTVDEEDVDPFIDLLLNGPYQVQADMNQDGVVDGRDVGLFVTTLSGSSALRVPEPSVLALVLAASTGLVLLRGRRRGGCRI